MTTLVLVLLVAAFIVTLISAIGRAPLWVAVLLIVLADLLDAAR
ncbi:MAG TPA: hypothetical protein VIX63_16500 [Vicinamibacterales bacterium]